MAFFLLTAFSPHAASSAPLTSAEWISEGKVAKNAEEYGKAVAAYEMALTLVSKAEDKKVLRLAVADMQFAWAQRLLPYRPAEALPHYQAALDIDQGRRIFQAALDLKGMGVACDELNQPAKAIDLYRQAIPLFRQVGSKNGEARDLNNLGVVYEELKRTAKALDYFQQALTLYRKIGDREGEAQTLQNMGLSYRSQRQYVRAIDCFQKVLPLLDQTGKRDGEARGLNYIGSAYRSLSRPALAIGYYEQSLPLFHQASDRDGEASALNNIGAAYLDLSEPAKALDYFQRALPIFRQVDDKDGEAKNLNNMGVACRSLNKSAQAIASYEQALPIYRQIGDKGGEGGILTNLGAVYEHLSRPAKAMDYFQQAQTLHQKIGDKDGAARDLSNLAATYDSLGQSAKALDFYRQALLLFRQAADRDGEGGALSNIGVAYERLRQPAKAITYYEAALPIYRQAGDKDGEADGLTNLGVAFRSLGQPAKALDYYKQAIPIYLLDGNKNGEAGGLNNMGSAYLDVGQPAKAIRFYQQALPIYRQTGNKSGEAGDSNNLMAVWQLQKSPQMAIFYGKHAVNVYQSIRAGLQSLDRRTQQTYLAFVSNTYRTLADLLISQGRLPEAEQVLTLLKRQEQDNVLRGPVSVSGIPGQVDMSPQEAAQEALYQQVADQITALGQEQQSLLDIRQRSKETFPAKDQQRLDDITRKLAAASHHLRLFLDQLSAVFHASAPANSDLLARLQSVKAAAGLQETLRGLHDKGEDVVVLETVIAPDRYAVIVTTAKSRKVEQYSIKVGDLNKKIAALQAALRDYTVDPRGPAHDLYTIVVAPIEADLQQAHAKILMWSLDGSLRYIPIAALYDGKQYLMERFDNEVFTLGSQSGFGSDDRTTWVALGLGVSHAHNVDNPGGGSPLEFPALDNVPSELHGVVKDAAHPDGILSGTVRLDTQFSRDTLTHDIQSQQYNVVHVASHFALLPATPDQSFLLLGDGQPLMLSVMADDATLFSGVDMLVLSACDTASGGTDGDGKEVDSLGSVAQQDGAKSVLASLWPVADASTRLLMEAFYAWHRDHPGTSKAEALRQAQMALLHGTVRETASDVIRAHRATMPDQLPDFVAFPVDPKVPYAHPYFWAPFVLIGNWK